MIGNNQRVFSFYTSILALTSS